MLIDNEIFSRDFNTFELRFAASVFDKWFNVMDSVHNNIAQFPLIKNHIVLLTVFHMLSTIFLLQINRFRKRVKHLSVRKEPQLD